MTDDLTFVDDYFCDIGLPAKQNTIEFLDKAYRNEPGSLFHPNYSILDQIVRRHSHLGFRKGIHHTWKIALQHIQALLSKWRKERPPNTLLTALKQLIETAQTLRKNAPEVLQWILTSESQYKLPQHFNEKIKEAYSKLFVFLDKAARFEEILLEFMVFHMLAENCRPYSKGYAQNLLVFQSNFPLSNRLSKHFYQYYLNYLNCMNNAKENYKPVLIKADLFEYLCHDDNEFLLRLLEPVSKEVSFILSKNPSLYQRMSPKLWIELCEIPGGGHAINVLRNPKIYKHKDFDHKLLFQLIDTCMNAFVELLYERTCLNVPYKGILFAQLQDGGGDSDGIKMAREVLSRLTIEQLILLWERHFGLARWSAASILVYQEINKKIKMNSEEIPEQFNDAFLLRFLENLPKAEILYVLKTTPDLYKHIQPKLWIELCNKRNKKRKSDRRDCIDIILSYSVIYKRFNSTEAFQFLNSYVDDFQKEDQVEMRGYAKSR